MNHKCSVLSTSSYMYFLPLIFVSTEKPVGYYDTNWLIRDFLRNTNPKVNTEPKLARALVLVCFPGKPSVAA